MLLSSHSAHAVVERSQENMTQAKYEVIRKWPLMVYIDTCVLLLRHTDSDATSVPILTAPSDNWQAA